MGEPGAAKPSAWRSKPGRSNSRTQADTPSVGSTSWPRMTPGRPLSPDASLASSAAARAACSAKWKAGSSESSHSRSSASPAGSKAKPSTKQARRESPGVSGSATQRPAGTSLAAQRPAASSSQYASRLGAPGNSPPAPTTAMGSGRFNAA
jgi:hypothetical protein